MSTNVIDAPIPDPVLDGIAAIPNPESLAIALNRYPLLDPRNATIVNIVAGLPDGYWVGVLRQRLADLTPLDTKALQKLQKTLLKAPVNPLNIWIDAVEAAPVLMADSDIGDAATAATGTVDGDIV